MSKQARTPGDSLGTDKDRSAGSQAAHPGCLGADQHGSVAAAPIQPDAAGGTGHLPLRGGRTAVVDADVLREFGAYRWRVGARGYVVRTDKRGKTVYLHREILIAPKGMAGTFLNGDRLDLRRANLALATASDTARRRSTAPRSGYRGVSYNKVTGRCAARFHVPWCRKQVTFWEYATAREAAECRDAFERYFYGDLAKLNFPDQRFDTHRYGSVPRPSSGNDIAQFRLSRTSSGKDSRR